MNLRALVVRLPFLAIVCLALWHTTTRAEVPPEADLTVEPSASDAVVEPAAPRPAERRLAEIDLPPEAPPVRQSLVRQSFMASLTIFVLAVFVGFEVITKVPPTLHTPLMSGSNAISGITIVGAVVVAAAGWRFSSFIGFLAVVLAMINVVGGFMVTHRMLGMFRRR